MCVSPILHPPVFIAGSHGVKLAELPSATNEEMTRGEVETVGPMGQVDRPSWSVGLLGPPTTPNFFWWAVLGLFV